MKNWELIASGMKGFADFVSPPAKFSIWYSLRLEYPEDMT